jgi:lipopolysaccharide/colanic/teichoic acid biosynthesis glycosyltransferase
MQKLPAAPIPCFRMEVNPLPVQINPHPAPSEARSAKSDSRAALIKRRVDVPVPDLSRIRVPQSIYLSTRYACDRLAALLLFVAAAPVIALTALLVKWTSTGPAFYTQTRLGLRGRLFTIYKIRTMIHNCESLTGPRWSMPGDPRITPLGRFLRATHLDELPQLINVLRGDMCLIGPRPERPEFLPELQRELPHYADRLAVRPGVTGLAQIQLPADTDLDSVRRKLAYDLYYIHKVGLWLDVRILICTAFYAMGVPYRALRELFRIPNSEIVERHVQVALAPTPAPRQRLSA